MSFLHSLVCVCQKRPNTEIAITRTPVLANIIAAIYLLSFLLSKFDPLSVCCVLCILCSLCVVFLCVVVMLYSIVLSFVYYDDKVN